MTPFLSAHAKTKGKYTSEKKVEHEKPKIEYLQSQKDPSQGGFLLQKEKVLKPYDSNTIQLKYSKITKINDLASNFLGI